MCWKDWITWCKFIHVCCVSYKWYSCINARGLDADKRRCFGVCVCDCVVLHPSIPWISSLVHFASAILSSPHCSNGSQPVDHVLQWTFFWLPLEMPPSGEEGVCAKRARVAKLSHCFVYLWKTLLEGESPVNSKTVEISVQCSAPLVSFDGLLPMPVHITNVCPLWSNQTVLFFACVRDGYWKVIKHLGSRLLKLISSEQAPLNVRQRLNEKTWRGTISHNGPGGSRACVWLRGGLVCSVQDIGCSSGVFTIQHPPLPCCQGPGTLRCSFAERLWRFAHLCWDA